MLYYIYNGNFLVQQMSPFSYSAWSNQTSRLTSCTGAFFFFLGAPEETVDAPKSSTASNLTSKFYIYIFLLLLSIKVILIHKLCII